jgi:hypothetical protein
MIALLVALAAHAGPSGKAKTLWDLWYTVTSESGSHYSYYNDRAEVRDGRVIFQNHSWKNEEGYINEEQLGVAAEDTAELWPLFFNFHSNYRTTETQIDGTVKGNMLTIRARRGEKHYPDVTKSIPKKIIFEQVFQVWIGRHLKDLKPNQKVSFLTILEDNIDAEFANVPGMVWKMDVDATARELKAQKLGVEYSDRRSFWYVDELGAPIRILMPDQKLVIQRAPKQEAEQFLKGDK